jgi:hypothetical protein
MVRKRNPDGCSLDRAQYIYAPDGYIPLTRDDLPGFADSEKKWL